MFTSNNRPTVLLLGTAHIGNNNRDAFNTQFDDMLASSRQQEIQTCVDQLKRFRPTKIAVEVRVDNGVAENERYQQYRAGTFKLTANEIHQLGFRLAAELQHEQIYAIDWNENIGDLEAVDKYAKQHQPELYEQIMTIGQKLTDDSFYTTMSISKLLLWLNEPRHLLDNHQVYTIIARIGSGNNYIGIDWVEKWYGRNLKIFTNLTRIINSSDDRVLVIYGAGHIHLLTQFLRESELYTMENVETYLHP